MPLPGPDTYVVELRVPGTASPSPEAVVGGMAAVDVAGDGVGRLLRPADRLLRPAPGPVLSTGGRPVPRTIEGYCWAAMPPRGVARVGWALLLPFTMANAAHWMLPPGNSAGLGVSLRTLLRVCALLLTMMLAAQLTIAGQQLPLARGLPGLLPAVVAVLAMHRLSRVRWTAPAVESGGTGIGAGLTGDPDAAALRALHTTAALATVTMLAAGGLGVGPRWLPAPTTTVTAVGVLLAATVTLAALLLVPAARAAAPRWRTLPRGLRPWVGGWTAAPVLALAGLLGAGLGAGLTLAARELAGPGGWPLPTWYRPLLEGWGATAVLLVVAAPALALRVRSRLRHDGTAPELRALHGAAIPEGVPAAWRRAAVLHRAGHRLMVGTTGLLVLACGLTSLGSIDGPVGIDTVAGGLITDGLVVIGLVALATAAVAVAAATTGTSRLAIVLELLSCWPRESHPMVPPCPALKAVPELVARAETHLADPGARVVLAGQGYGSVLATVAATRLTQRLSSNDRERLGLVTAGAPLQWAYARAFPAVVPPQAAAGLAGALQGRWRAMCRGTDPGGSAVTTWSRQLFDDRLLGAGLRPDGTSGALPAARQGTHGALVLGGDHWLPDPQHGPVGGRRWRAGVLGAADYTCDPEWEAAVALAAGLVTTVATSHPTSHPGPGSPQRGSVSAAARVGPNGYRADASLDVRSRSGSR